jgi:hypothetical protein
VAGQRPRLLNVVEQLVWLSINGVVELEHLPLAMRHAPVALAPVGDRRRQVADDLYDKLVRQEASFWEDVYPMFLARDLTRHDLRELVRRGLRESQGRYKSMLTLFGLPSRDYRRFMNFLAAHGCGIGVREFRGAAAISSEMPPVHAVPAESPAESAVRPH